MRLKWTILMVLGLIFLLSACSKPEKEIEAKFIQERGGLLYEANNKEPFTGKVYELYQNSPQKMVEKRVKEGRIIDKVCWYPNGILESKSKYNKGKEIESVDYYESGQIESTTKYGDQDSQNEEIRFYENGEKESIIYWDGKRHIQTQRIEFYKGGAKKSEFIMTETGYRNTFWSEIGARTEVESKDGIYHYISWGYDYDTKDTLKIEEHLRPDEQYYYKKGLSGKMGEGTYVRFNRFGGPREKGKLIFDWQTNEWKEFPE